MLQAVFDYSLKWRVKFNYDKCSVIRFDNQQGGILNYGKCEKNCNCGNPL